MTASADRPIGAISAIRDTREGAVYISCSKDIARRMAGHLRALTIEKHHN